ncbi:MAG: hypothetical protein E6Q78_03085 [Rhodoferax sp.]|nr:MAG: hypothetical protein E6Q78_03085 [Rhodoferax sp.]
MSTTVGAGQETISFGSNGTPVLNPSSGNIGTSGGNINVTRTGAIRLPSGQSLPVTAAARITSASAGQIIGKALRVGLGVGNLVGIGLLAAEFGYRLINDNGTATVEKQGEGDVCTSNCYLYRGYVYGTSTPSPATFVSNLSAQCSAYIAAFRSANPSHSVFNIVSSYVGASPACTFTAQRSGYGPGYYSMAIDKIATQPYDTREFSPSTPEALEAEISAKPSWPDSSAVPQALDEAQRITGDQIPTEGPDVSGPSSVVGPAEVTKTPITNGQRQTTKQTNYDCIYLDGVTVMDGGTVSCTEKVTTTQQDTLTDPQTQQTTVTTTQTAETTKPADTASEKPKETTDPCEANPDRAGCSTLDTPQGEIPKVTKTFNYEYEELGLGNGSCPAPVTVNTSNGSYTLNLGQYCDAISTYVRPVVILFGMLAAFFIAIPVKTENA